MKRLFLGALILAALFAAFTVPINGDTAINHLAKAFNRGDSGGSVHHGAAMAPLGAPSAGGASAAKPAPAATPVMDKRAVQAARPMERLTQDDEQSLDDLINTRSR